MTKKRHFPDWIKAYMSYSAESEAPDKFHYWTAVGVVAGALRRRVWLEMGYFQWTPNMYLIFVAPPGIVSKSTTANIGMNLIREVPGIKFGPDAVTWQALSLSLAQSTVLVLMPDGLYHPMSALTIVSGELGTFFNPSDREMVDLLVALWDGQKGVFSKVTKTQGNDIIENPWVNLLGCTTPAWIAGNFPAYLIGGGFTSRCIFVYSDYKRHLNAYPITTLPKDFKTTRARLIEDLSLISSMAGEFTLTPDAIIYGTKWYEEHYKNKTPWLNNDRFAGYLARKQTHIHKLAIVLSAASRDDMLITEKDLEIAIKIIGTIESDMPKVFMHIGKTDEALAVMEIVQTVKAYGTVKAQALLQHCLRVMGKDAFDRAIKGAVSGGFLEVKQRGNEVFVVFKSDAPAKLN